MGKPAVEEGARRPHLIAPAVGPDDLPVPAGLRQLEKRLAEIGADDDLRIVGSAGEVGDQQLHIDAEAPIEAALDRRAVHGVQHEAGQRQQHDGEGEREENEAPRQRGRAGRGGHAQAPAGGGCRM